MIPDEAEQFLTGLQFEALHVIIVLLGVEINDGINLVRPVFFQDVKVIFEMVLQVE